MKYTQAMFDQDFKDTHTLTLDSFNYEYFVALEDIPKWNGKWDREETYMARNAKTGEGVWIHFCNIHNNVKKNEIFIGGVYKNNYRHSVSVCRSTGCFTLSKKKNTKREIRVAREVNRIRFKRERPLYNWYESEIDKINKKINEAYQEMDANLCALVLPEKKIDNKYKFKASEKNIKTKYGIEKDAYDSDFELDCDPYNGKIHKDFKSIKGFENKNEFRDAQFPLYEIKHKGIIYLFEKSDFEFIKNYNEEVEIEYINQWEDRVCELQVYAKKCKKWLNRCLYNIKVDVCNKYGHPVMRW